MVKSRNKTFSAKQIAAIVDGEVVGNHQISINHISTLANASGKCLAFLGNNKYRTQVSTSRAPIVLVPEDFNDAPPDGRTWIKCKDPSAAFSVITSHFIPPSPPPPPGVHKTAIITESVDLPSSAHIGPYVVIEDHVIIGKNAIIEAGSFIGRSSAIGNDSRLYPNVTLREQTIIGDRVTVHCGTVIGCDGFGYTMSSEGHKKIPQLGYVQIDDDVEIGANVTIDRARFDRTWIKKGVKIDNQVQIAHNVIIGENSIIVAQTGIAGSVVIGNGVILAGQSGVAGHITIGDRAIIMAKTGVINDVEPDAVMLGMPPEDRQKFWKQYAYYRKLPDFARKLKQIEKELQALKEKTDAFPDETGNDP